MGAGASNEASAHPPPSQAPDQDTQKATDSRLPYQQYRDLFTLRNYWKTVQRNQDQCASAMMFKYKSLSFFSCVSKILCEEHFPESL